ncbi:hypothetical protein D3C85_1458040 [compost metagenome]
MRSSRVVSFSSWFSLNSIPKAPRAFRAYSCSVRRKPQPVAFDRPPALSQASGLIWSLTPPLTSKELRTPSRLRT